MRIKIFADSLSTNFSRFNFRGCGIHTYSLPRPFKISLTTPTPSSVSKDGWKADWKVDLMASKSATCLHLSGVSTPPRPEATLLQNVIG